MRNMTALDGENLKQLAHDIMVWQDSGMLPHNSYFAEFAESLTEIPAHNRLAVAEAMVNRRGLEELANGK